MTAAFWLTVINSKERAGIVFFLSDFARNILAQQIQSLISAMARHLLTRNHLQQREKNRFKVFGCICNGTKYIIVSIKNTNMCIAAPFCFPA